MCTGKPHDGSFDFGKCRLRAPLSGEGASCSASKPCEAGLVCVGMLRWSNGEGTCSPGWMQTTLRSDGPLAVTGPKQEQHVVVYGQATVPVDVQLSVKVAHSSLSSLRITLSDPYGDNVVSYWDGTKETVFPDSKVMGNSGDASINGKWTLVVENVDGKGSGEVTSWSLYLTSRWD
eukprot:TRINITY_DN46231_c0_g1_i2.p4 TRINITY_DN46231_c0_g1~~TRINITY_DN46231_c0_g1_i2.p4  ORF type:complete len:176 (+),score=49.08 TRINITY_DN46231_c0_g1_i2:476-1003(+)